MNKEKFIDCLRDPSLLQDNEINELNVLVNKYPYFQGARALLAKVSKERNLKDAALRISSAAVYTTDRALLKKYISDHLFFLDSREAVKEEKVSTQPAAPTPRPPADSTGKKNRVRPEKRSAKPQQPDSSEKKPAPKSERPEAKQPPVANRPKQEQHPKPEGPKTNPKPKVSKLQKAAATPSTKKTAPVTPSKEAVRKPVSAPIEASSKEEELTSLTPSDTTLDDWIIEIHKDIEDLKVSRAKFQELEKKLEEEDKQKEEEDAVNAALKKVTSTDSTPKQAEPEKESEATSLTEDPSFENISVEEKNAIERNLPLNAKEEKPVKAKAPKKKVPAKKVEEPKADEPEEKVAVSYAALKKRGKPKKEEVKAEEKPAEKEPAKKEKAPEHEDPTTLKVVRRRSGKVQSTTFENTEADKPEKDSKDKIIEKFISESPKISKADKARLATEDGEKEDLADKSGRFQADIGTEYLAEIYVEQGKEERAISIYEKLSLKFPEKRSYFVARIEELKSK